MPTNLELVQTAVAAYFSGDESALREIAAPQVTVSTRPDQPDFSEHSGVDGLIAFLGEWTQAWEDYSFEFVRIWEDAGAVFATGRQRGRGKRSGLPVDDQVTFAFSFADAKIVRLQMFADESDALAAIRR